MSEITVKATLEQMGDVMTFVDAALEEMGCSMRAQMQIDVAMDELFGNVARYAYAPGEGDVTVGFELDEATRTAQITLTDSGVPFNPLKAAEPDLTASAEDRPIGGLGIFLVRKTMDSLEYRYENGKNILTIRKKI